MKDRSDDVQKLATAFKYYRDTVFEIDNDLRFWEPRLKGHVDDLIDEKWLKDQPYLFQSLFSVYNTRIDKGLILHTKTHTITTQTIQNDRRNFFVWIENLSCLRTYNALELLLFQAIYLRYFPTYNDPFNNSKAIKIIKDEIGRELKLNSIKYNATNNSYLIDFLKIKSVEVNKFLNQLCNQNEFVITWRDFFTFISIIRNSIAHYNSVLNSDVLSSINSKCKDFFEYYFETKNESQNYITFRAKSTEGFLNYKTYYDTFILNIIREMFIQEDFHFIEKLKF